MTDAELITELAKPAYQGKTFDEKLAILNGPKAGFVLPVLVPKADLLLAIAACHERIAAKSTNEQAMWFQLLATIRSLAEGVYVVHPAIVAFFEKAVVAGVLMQDEVDYVQSLGVRPGTVAESIGGPGDSVSGNQLARVS